MRIRKARLIVSASMALLAWIATAQADMPQITGKPVLDTPVLLAWPLDSRNAIPALHDPDSNVLYDLHGQIDACDLVLSTEGNYHMVLRDIWPQVLKKLSAEHVAWHNVLYTTSPPVFIPQLKNGTVQFDNLNMNCHPSVAVGSKTVIDKLVADGYAEGKPVPLYQDRGDVILVKKGNPKHIESVWDLGRAGVHLVTPNPEGEPGAYISYRDAIYNIAKADKHPPPGWTAEKLIDVIFNGTSGDRDKWLTGYRIHHRDEPWSVAYGKADAAVILYHLGRYTAETFPALFDIVPLGGTASNPQPLPGTKVDVRYVAAIKGNWSPRQKKARDILINILLSDSFTQALERRGLKRPPGFTEASRP
ncbi:MAG: substrate-binding domain-containing protein [Burkholderiales bacterium]